MTVPDYSYVAPPGHQLTEGTDSWDGVFDDERRLLQVLMQRQRELVAWKTLGCPVDVLQARRTPTGMTVLGIVAHLTVVERTWFRARVAGQPDLDLPDSQEAWDNVFVVEPGRTAEQVLADYATECRLADEAVADIPLTAADSRPGDEPSPNLRWVYLHMIEETARHVGHLDLLRELADGLTGEDRL